MVLRPRPLAKSFQSGHGWWRYQGGQVYGSSDAIASEPEDKPLSVMDWASTIYHCMGIVSDKELMAPGDRPIEIVDGGKVVKSCSSESNLTGIKRTVC